MSRPLRHLPDGLVAKTMSDYIAEIKQSADGLTDLLRQHARHIKAIGGKEVADMSISEKMRVAVAIMAMQEELT